MWHLVTLIAVVVATVAVCEFLLHLGYFDKD